MIQVLLPQNKTPHFYAAAEEWMVRNLKNDHYFFTYINQTPCVVLGKNQSVWSEVNWNFIRQQPQNIVRRISGGGTVYHDSGNINFGFIVSFDDTKINNYKWFNQPILDALALLGIKATFSERNDLLYNGFKISGNAQFTDRKMMLSHGTLLFDANMVNLKVALSPNDFNTTTKAVKSVRSNVKNLKDITSLSQPDFYKKLIEHLPIKERLSLIDSELKEIEHLQKEKYETKVWTFDKSPNTFVEKKNISFNIIDGCIENINTCLIDFPIELITSCRMDFEVVEKKMLQSKIGATKTMKFLNDLFS
jgi:lipoate-protein ligase A